jgi:hypothetical protein
VSSLEFDVAPGASLSAIIRPGLPVSVRWVTGRVHMVDWGGLLMVRITSIAHLGTLSIYFKFIAKEYIVISTNVPLRP